MECWTILADDGEFDDLIHDPGQTIRPALARNRSSVAWLPTDGRVISYPARGFEIMINDRGHKTIVEVPGQESQLFVTDRRVVLWMSDIDPGAGSATGLADFVSGGVVATLRDFGRWSAGKLGTRAKYHLAAQIDYMSLAFVRYYQATTWPARSLLNLGVLTGESAPRVLEIVGLSVARKDDVGGMAKTILARAKAAQTHEDLRPLTPIQRDGLIKVAFERNGDGFMASFASTCIPLTELAHKSAVVSDVDEHGTLAEPPIPKPAKVSAPDSSTEPMAVAGSFAPKNAPPPEGRGDRSPGAGWYRDPLSQAYRLRYWDGLAWTDRVD